MPDLINEIKPTWKIIIPDGTLSDSQAAYDPASSTAMVPYRVPHDDLEIVPQHFCGYSYVQAPIGGIGSHQLRRVLPQPHPQGGCYEGLWGSRVNIQGEISTTQTNFKANRKGPYDRYEEYRVEVFYSRRPYDVRGNAEVTKEQQRYVEKLPGKPYSEVVSVEGGQLKFADGTHYMNGTPIRVGKVDIKWVWHEVPILWAHDSDGVMTNINVRLGTINDAAWEGFDAGTLLLADVDTEYTYSQSSPLILGLPSYSPPRYLKITFQFKYFEHGWQKVLHPGKREWEEVTFTLDGKKLYEETDFDKLFEKAA